MSENQKFTYCIRPIDLMSYGCCYSDTARVVDGCIKLGDLTYERLKGGVLQLSHESKGVCFRSHCVQAGGYGAQNMKNNIKFGSLAAF